MSKSLVVLTAALAASVMFGTGVAGTLVIASLTACSAVTGTKLATLQKVMRSMDAMVITLERFVRATA